MLHLASDLLAHFGGLRGLLAADTAELEQRRGLGPVKSAQLTAVLELSKRYLHEALVRGSALESPRLRSCI